MYAEWNFAKPKRAKEEWYKTEIGYRSKHWPGFQATGFLKLETGNATFMKRSGGGESENNEIEAGEVLNLS